MALDQTSILLIQSVRQRMERGENVPLEEYQEAIKLMREGRVAAQTASDASRRTKAKAEIPSADDLLGDLMK